MVCQKSGDYVLTEGTESVQFQVSQIWRFYRWSFVFFSGEKALGYLTLGQNYTIRIWVSDLSLDQQIQSELNGKETVPGDASKALTRVFYGLSEFPVVSLIGFDEEKLNMTYNSEGCYWEGTFPVTHMYLRRLVIVGHQISDMVDVISDVDVNLEYRNLYSIASLLTDASLPADGKIVSIFKTPCYPNVAMLALQETDATRSWWYTEDDFQTLKKFGDGKKITDVHLSPIGVYYAVGNDLYLNEAKEPVYHLDEPIIGVYGEQSCDFCQATDSLSLENYVVGIYSAKQMKLAKDGENFIDTIMANTNNQFVYVAYQQHRITALVVGDTASLKLVSFDVSDPVPSEIMLPSSIEDGAIAYSQTHGFFCYARTANFYLFYSPEYEMMSRVFFSDYLKTDTIVYLDFYGDNYVVTTSSGAIYYGNINHLECDQLLSGTSAGRVGYFNIQGQVELLTVTATGLVRSSVVHKYSFYKNGFSTIDGTVGAVYLDAGDKQKVVVNISTVTLGISAVRIVAPSFVHVKSTTTSEAVGCSSLLTALYLKKELPYDPMDSSDTCMIHHIEADIVPIMSWMDNYSDKINEGRGSAPIELIVSQGNSVFGSFSIPVVTGCPPFRRLGFILGRSRCAPGEECRIGIPYGQKLHPIPLLYENGEVVRELKDDYVLISNATGLQYTESAESVGCKSIPQTSAEYGMNWSPANYRSCFDGETVIDSSEPYQILNISSSNEMIFTPKEKEVKMRLAILGSTETTCHLTCDFTIYVSEHPLDAPFYVLAIFLALVFIAAVIGGQILYEKGTFRCTRGCLKKRNEGLTQLESDKDTSGHSPTCTCKCGCTCGCARDHLSSSGTGETVDNTCGSTTGSGD